MAEPASQPVQSRPPGWGVAVQERPLVGPASLDPVEYPETDGYPMPDESYQGEFYRYAANAVRAHFKDRPEVYISGNLFIYLEEGNSNNRIAPDLFGVMRGGNHLRDTYLLWEEDGGIPEVAMEFVSPTTWEEDLGPKRERYAALGIGEYWLCDPLGRLMDPALAGFRLVGGVYKPLPRLVALGGEHRMWSETLGLELRLSDGDLRFFDRGKGCILLNYRELLAKLETLRKERCALEAKRRILEAETRALIATRLTAEAETRAVNARVAELESSRQLCRGPQSAPVPGNE